MDDITRQVIEYAGKFWNSTLPASTEAKVNDVMLDAMACVIAGCDSDAVRAAARVARMVQGVTMKSTVLGHGISTSPELAAFANCCMVRENDFNDLGAGGHPSDIIPAVLAMGEAVHASGTRILQAVTLTFEVMGAFQTATPRAALFGFDVYTGPSAAVAIGKLMGLNDDQLANAFSLSLLSHIGCGVSHAAGPLSMMKGARSAEGCRNAVFSCIAAKEGFTGPCAPFKGTLGLCDIVAGGPFSIELPVPAGKRVTGPAPDSRTPGQMVVEATRFKRYPAEAGTQGMIRILPEFGQWTKPYEIASIDVEMTSWGEIGDPAKWDPRNEQTADHSVPYIIARHLVSGEIYLDGFTKEKLMDPAARALMDKIVIREVPEIEGSPKITITKKSGEKMVKESPFFGTLTLTHDEVVAKFDRICDFKSVTSEQKERIRSTWQNLKAVPDISVPISGIARFGKPKPL